MSQDELFGGKRNEKPDVISEEFHRELRHERGLLDRRRTRLFDLKSDLRRAQTLRSGIDREMEIETQIKKQIARIDRSKQAVRGLEDVLARDSWAPKGVK